MDRVTPPTVLIVDDHAGFRARVRRTLEAEGYQVIGEAADAAGGLAEARRLRPDVVLLDVHLPDRSGIEIARELSGGTPPSEVVLVSTYEALEVGPIEGSGARGFLHKGKLSGAALRELLER